MNAVILAGGKGERLRPLTNWLPKALVPVYDRPMICHVIDKLMWCRRITIVGYQFRIEGALHHFYSFEERKKFEFVFDGCVPENIALQDGILGSDEEEQIVWFCDNILKCEVSSNMFENWERSTVFIAKRETNQRLGNVEIEKGDVKSISSSTIGNFVQAGIMVLKRKDVLNAVYKSTTDLLNKLAKQGKLGYVVLPDGMWTDVGTFDSLVRVVDELHTCHVLKK